VNGGSIINHGIMEGNYSVYDGHYSSADIIVDSTSSLRNYGSINLEGGDIVIANGADFSAGTLRLAEVCYWSGGGDNCIGGNLIIQKTSPYTFSTASFRQAKLTIAGLY